MSEYQNNSIFWVETTKIKPNPFQPRKEFEPKALEDLADSIRQYGVLQPLVVTRKETLRPDNHGMDVHYELIAGERRLRASKLAGLAQVPVIIRKETDDKVKLELAIIENLQREDLNPIDRALAFEQLYKQFNLTHVQIGKRMGKSRVYVSNSLRLLSLPEEIKQGLMAGKISEGHTRPLLMLIDRPQEQTTLYKEIMVKKMSVRDAEKVARSIAQDKVRKKEFIIDPRIRDFEKKLSENLGTRVHIEPKENGGQITIDYFTLNDLEEILKSMRKVEREKNMMERYIADTPRIKKEIKNDSLKNMNALVDATGINIDSMQSSEDIPKEKETHQEIETFHKSLPAYTKHEQTDIQEYHQEIAAPELKQENTVLSKAASAIDTHKDNEIPIAVDIPVAPVVNPYLTTQSEEEFIPPVENPIDEMSQANDYTADEIEPYQVPEVPTASENFEHINESSSSEIMPTIEQSYTPQDSPNQTQDNLYGSNQPNQRYGSSGYDQGYSQSQEASTDQYQPNYSQTRYIDSQVDNSYQTNQQAPQNQNYQNNQNYYQPVQKKKGFFGKLFG